jgi:hypothetical protein
MKHKKLSFGVREDYIRGVASNVIGQIMGTLASSHTKNLKIVNQSLSTGSAGDILESLEDLIEGLEHAIVEFNKLGDLVGCVPDLEKEPEEPEEATSKKK